MKTAFKVFAIVIAAIFTFSGQVHAQKISAAIVDQNSSAETANYKLMMIGLAVAYAVYLMLTNKRKKEINRLYGRVK